MDVSVLAGSYHTGLVACSILIAMIASYTALELARQVTDSAGMARRLWLTGGAMTMGLGIWAMHFIGMLAFRLPVAVAYEPILTLLSLLIAIFASALALQLVSRHALNNLQWIAGGVIMGGGIAAMHYTGMMAMRMAASMRYDPLLFVISIIVAVVVSLVALQLAFRLRATHGIRAWWLKLGSAVVMGMAIAGMHYTGMAATIFEAQAGIVTNMSTVIDPLKLAVSVIIGSFILLVTTLSIIILNKNVIARLLASDTLIGRYWLLVGAALYIVLFLLFEAVLHAYVFEQKVSHGQGMFSHLMTDDPNELWMRAAVILTAAVLAVIGHRIFSHARTLNREVVAVRDHLEDMVAVRTAAHEESEQRVRAILEKLQDPFVATNSKGRIMDWNRAAEALFGWERMEMIGRPIAEMLFPGCDPDQQMLPGPGFDQSTIETGGHTLELTATCSDRQEVPVEVSVSPLHLASGMVYNILIRDISERKEHEQSLLRAKEIAEQANRMKSEFLANMSHELRTPLNAIIGFTEVLKDRLVGELNSEQHDYISEVFDSSHHLLALINDILDLSKVEAGKMELELSQVDVGYLLRNSLTIIKEKAHAHAIKLELELVDELEEIELDERKFKQIIYNLLSNAVKFTPDGGRIGLVAQRKEEWLDVVVWDSGIGINAHDQIRLFQPFVQADGSIARKYQGTGLGLSLARRFANLHGGDIRLESAPGEGSRFTVRVPYKQVQECTEATHISTTRQQEADQGNLQAPMLLVIEDNDQAAASMMAQLRNAGYRTLWARSGEEGLELLQQVRPDSILLDIMLPDMDGWQVLQQLKADSEFADIPVVVVSIVADAGKGMTLGALETLEKPVNREHLLKVVERATHTQDNTRHARVLVVDDDPQALELMRVQLEDHGYRVNCTGSGADAIGQLQSDPPDLLILDLMMPEVTGFDVLTIMHHHEEVAHIPVIILSAKNLTEAEREFLQRHTQQIIGKTDFDTNDFLGMVHASLQRAG